MHTAYFMLTSRVQQAVRYIRTSWRWESITHFSCSNVNCNKERIGPNGIQMLSKFLHEQIFGGADNVQWDPASVEESQQELARHGLSDKKVSLLEDVQLQLPSLYGNNINDHFYQIASQQLEPYMKLINNMLGAQLPPSPSEWSMAEGWTRYEHDEHSLVPSPPEDCLVLDVEVCVQESNAPTLAVAASPTHWYSWVSKRLASGEDDFLHKSGGVSDELISLGGFSEEAGLVIGHNVCYDRARVKEQYNIKVKYMLTQQVLIAMYLYRTLMSDFLTHSACTLVWLVKLLIKSCYGNVALVKNRGTMRMIMLGNKTGTV